MEMIEESRLIKAFLCDYADAYTLVTGDIAVTGANANTRVVLKIVIHLLSVKLI